MARLTDQVGTLDTSGTRGGPHTRLDGVAPVFDLAKENEGNAPKRDISLEERAKELAVAGNGDTAEKLPEHNPASHQAAAITDQVPDTTGTDTQSASGKDHETVQALQTDTWDTTGGQPSASIDGITDVEDGTSLKGEGSYTTAAASGAEVVAEVSEALGTSTEDTTSTSTDEDPLAGLDPEKVAAFQEIQMNDLYRLAKKAEPPVTIPSGTRKSEMIALLIEAGVSPEAQA